MIKNEWKKLLTNPMLILVLVVIMLIPAMYSGLFLASMWDPYGELDKLPVAVVNLDKEVEFNGNTLHIGNDLVKNFEDSNDLDFDIVDSQTAEEGLIDGKYYMIITIPEDFSYQASTATLADPGTMQLLYTTNPATNYVATKLSESAMTRIELSLQQTITNTYINALINTINGVGVDIQTAADGSSQIYGGMEILADGVVQLSEGSSTLADGTIELKTGAITLSSGVKTLDDATTELATGASTLSDGATELKNGTIALNSGLSNYIDGVIQLNTGITTLYQSVPALVTGASNLSDAVVLLHGGSSAIVAGFEGDNGILAGSKSLADGSATLNSMIQNSTTNPIITIDESTLNAISTSAASQASALITSDNDLVKIVAAGLQAQYAAQGEILDNDTAIAMAIQYVQALVSTTASQTASSVATQVASNINDQLPNTLGVYTKQIADGAEALSTGLNTVYSGATTLDGGLASLEEGASTLNGGISALKSGIDALYAGSTTLVSNNDALINGSDNLVTGATALDEGASTLSSAADQISSGTSTLATGATDLANGATDVADGMAALDDGIQQLNDSVPTLTSGTNILSTSLQVGADTFSSTSLGENNALMMSNPVDTSENQITAVDNNGSAMAAYMMSVGLWVACLAFCLMYPLTEHSQLKNGFAWWASKASVLLPIAIVQGAVLICILKFALGFSPARLGETIFISCLTSLAFMAIMYFFNAFLGKVGSFIMLLFMVLQLAGSAGTYPIELSGPLANALHKFVPFTYTVNAFRSSIGGGTSIKSSVAVLIALVVVFTLLTIALFTVRSLDEKQSKESIHDWLDSKGLA